MPLVLTRRLQPLRGLLDLAPIVTVVLLLLCFFLLSSSFILQPGIKVDPPKAGFSGGTPSSRLIVAISLAPRTAADGTPEKSEPVLYFNDQIVTLDGLRSALDQLPPSRTTPALIVKADKDVPFDLIASIMDIAVHHRPQLSVVLATQPVETAPVP